MPTLRGIWEHFRPLRELFFGESASIGRNQSRPHAPTAPRAINLTTQDIFVRAFEVTQAQVHENAKAKGFWDEEQPEGLRIALVHGELSEALEGLRHGNPASEHIPAFTAAEEEYADAIIRIMDNAQAMRYRLAEAIIAKMAFNAGRPHRHGKVF